MVTDVWRCWRCLSMYVVSMVHTAPKNTVESTLEPTKTCKLNSTYMKFTHGRVGLLNIFF